MKPNLTESPPDYGFDHFERDETGKVITWKLVPSGRIVNAKQLADWRANRKTSVVKNDCLGLSWDQIEQMQGGKLTRPKS